MDKKDEKIIEALKENARLSTQKIAKKTRIPITTVHHRIKKLEKEGVIDTYTVTLNKKKIGLNVSAYILVTIDYNTLKQQNLTQEQIAKKIQAMDGVTEAAVVVGGTDIVLRVYATDITALKTFVIETLRNIDAVKETQTMVVLE
ncbi:MAG: Lrp/AsnC family transcriptional regulator [Candidatus Woesearchaeota archaeon]|nr:Lrp/AsnC family transcriptional regulator [Candidatus Woesearchaeota archaeon]